MSKAKVGDDKTTSKEYRYTTEISQMVRLFLFVFAVCLRLSSLQMFVFGEVQDPLTETVNLVEDIVRGQVVEIVSGIVIVVSRRLT
jgi:transcription initiation protein SPT3